MLSIMLEQCMADQVKRGVVTKTARAKPRVKLTRGEPIPQVRVYGSVHNNKTLGNHDEFENTTIAQDETVSTRLEDAPPEIPPVPLKQEKEDLYENMPVPQKVPEISESQIKIDKMDIDEEKISEVGQSATNEEVKEKEGRKDIIDITEELTEFLDIKPDIIKEERLSDDEAAQATKELTNLLQMSDTGESDISKVFKASSTFAEEVTDNSEHSKVYQISKTILETRMKQINEEPVESVSKDPIAASTSSGSTKESASETSDLSLLNLEPQILLKAGYRKRNIYRCHKCVFSGYHREYREHINDHNHKSVPKELKADINYQCTKCDKGFRTIKKYALHFEKHGYPYMSCPQCSQDFESITKLISHLKAHIKEQFIKVQLIISVGISRKVYQCKKCKDILGVDKWFEHWEKHLKLKKPSVRPVQRLKVGEKGGHALNASLLKEVLVILTKQFTSDSIYAKACVVCSRVFDRKNDTKRHLIEHLLEDAFANMVDKILFKCQICQELLKKPNSYRKHMRDHTNLPIYKCGLCNKIFSDSSNFTKHKKLHNLKAFICDICSKKFQAKKYLEKHMKMHMETEPITCTPCARVFHDHSYYRPHCRKRKKNAPRCMFCREKFASLSEKWDHLWNVHKQRKKEADCPICGISYRKFIDVKKHALLAHGMSIKSKVRERQGTADLKVGEGSQNQVKEEIVSSDDDCQLIEERETLIVYD